MAAVDIAMVRGTFLVDVFPIRTNSNRKKHSQKILHCLFPVKYVPEWFPGAGFKTFARIAKKDLDNCMDPPFQQIKESFEVRGPLTTIPHPSGSLGRTSGGDPYHSVSYGNVF